LEHTVATIGTEVIVEKLLHNNGDRGHCWNTRLHCYATMGIKVIVGTAETMGTEANV
jgi:hypothetical protein